ncbi:MAG: PSD1 and planctomycete cytochrome C domain-containing protein [Pirellulales bacterium]
MSAESGALAAPPVQYNRDVLPILADNCFRCHGFDQKKREAGLRLDTIEGATQELDSGARAITPRDMAQSALIDRIFTADTDELMPPKDSGKRLTPTQKEVLRLWVKQGADYQAHWAFIPPERREPPVVAKVDHPIDRFVRARLEKENIRPSPRARRTTLIRRLSLDLTGLPPTPLEVDAFVHDSRPDAYERVVNRLLASEHFGEHWARWWLDLAHYADSDGYLTDFIRPVAWRYRQWVVDAFNRDLPFDQFTMEQLAGDLLPSATPTQRMATGFLRNTLSNREGGADLEEYRVGQVIDRTSTVATSWLALTFACAECHDHKYDPISQQEFYQLYAFFNNADEINFNAPLPGEFTPWADAKPKHDRQRAELLVPLAEPLAELQAKWEKEILFAEANPGEDFSWDRKLELLGLQWGQDLGGGQLEGLNILKIPLAERTRDQQDRLLDYFLKNIPAVYEEKAKELKLSELRSRLESLSEDLPEVTRAPGMMRSVVQRTTHIHVRGNFRRFGDEVKANTPAVLPAIGTDTKVDRLSLARWLVSPQHPLTARVAVNRLWQKLFGRGIVVTSENFGVRGERPTHPKLLDWLALEFPRQQWSVKEMLRVIVTSQTYQQSSRSRPELAKVDPDNEFVARQARLRLSAESVRDSALAVSGLLSPTVGGPCVKPQQPASVSEGGYRNEWETSQGADRYRRGLYTFIQRTSPFAQFVTFDMPDTSHSCTRRERSNTPLQALNLLNDPAFFEAAQALTVRIMRESPNDDASRLNQAFQIVLARPVQPKELERLLTYLDQQKRLYEEEATSRRKLLQDSSHDGGNAEYAAWITLSTVLLNLDETITRE